MNYSRHHVTPRSRIRKSKNTVLLPEKFHDSWHYLFGDLTPIETIFFLKELNARMHKKRIITKGEIQELREGIKEGRNETEPQKRTKGKHQPTRS